MKRWFVATSVVLALVATAVVVVPAPPWRWGRHQTQHVQAPLITTTTRWSWWDSLWRALTQNDFVGGSLSLAIAGFLASTGYRFSRSLLDAARRALSTTYLIPFGSPAYFAAVRFVRSQPESRSHTERTVLAARIGEVGTTPRRPYIAAPALRRGVLTSHNGVAMFAYRLQGGNLADLAMDDMLAGGDADVAAENHAATEKTVKKISWTSQILGVLNWLDSGGADGAQQVLRLGPMTHPLANVGAPSGPHGSSSVMHSMDSGVGGSSPLVFSVFARPSVADATIESLLALGRVDALRHTQVYAPFTANSGPRNASGGMSWSEPLPEWRDAGKRPSRPLRSVVLPSGEGNRVLRDAHMFLKGERWYAERGIPWRRGYLFYGPPGCGKTSLAFALAGELRCSLYTLRLGSLASDDALFHLIRTTAPRSIILMEDVDAALPHELTTNGEGPSRTELVGRHGITLAGILEVLDGAALSNESRIIIMTTNFPDVLVPSLVRPGRVDLRFCLPLASIDMARRLFLSFYAKDGDIAAPEEEKEEESEVTKEVIASDVRLNHRIDDQLDTRSRAFSACIEPDKFSVAELQSLLMRYRHCSASAVEAARRGEHICTTW